MNLVGSNWEGLLYTVGSWVIFLRTSVSRRVRGIWRELIPYITHHHRAFGNEMTFEDVILECLVRDALRGKSGTI